MQGPPQDSGADEKVKKTASPIRKQQKTEEELHIIRVLIETLTARTDRHFEKVFEQQLEQRHLLASIREKVTVQFEIVKNVGYNWITKEKSKSFPQLFLTVLLVFLLFWLVSKI